MATVIFSNAGDTDTAVLKFIWRGLPNVKLVEVNKQTVNAKEIVEQAIEAEHDTRSWFTDGLVQPCRNRLLVFG